MSKTKNKKIIAAAFAATLLIAGCQEKEMITKNDEANQQEQILLDENVIMLSNMADDDSREEVKSLLKSSLSSNSVDNFIDGVVEYNETIEEVSLNKCFEKIRQPSYDVAKIDELWMAKKGDFIGTNCRINVFKLLREDIEIESGLIDDAMLFLDHEAIRVGKIFVQEDIERFNQLFSRVETEKTKDIGIHAKKMEEHFSKVKFNSEAMMVSVIFHDDLDGEYLFIGHTGILIKDGMGYLFVEKLSFQEPFQAIKFKEKEDCYSYLLNKYRNDYEQSTAQPFLMENGKLVKYSKKFGQ